jgi:hypothetical protein
MRVKHARYTQICGLWPYQVNNVLLTQIKISEYVMHSNEIFDIPTASIVYCLKIGNVCQRIKFLSHVRETGCCLLNLLLFLDKKPPS